MVNPVLQAALRKEALAKKRRERKKAQREEKPESGSSPACKQEGPSTSGARPEVGPTKASRWEAGVGDRVTDPEAAAQPAGPQSMMARNANAEIAAFKEQHKEKDDGAEQEGGNNMEVSDSFKGWEEREEREETELEKKGSSAASLGDTNDLDDLDDLDDSEAEMGMDMVAGECAAPGPPKSAPMRGPVRPNAGHVTQYEEVEMEDDEDDQKEQREESTAVNKSRDLLSTNKQQLFKRKMSMMQSCRDVDRYEKLNRISEGTYGVVYRGRDICTSTICALKRLKLDREKAGFPLTSVREISVLLALDHPNIVNVSEVVMGQRHAIDPRDDQIFMVMEYADHDLGSLTHKWTIAEVKCLMLQLLSGVAYLHENYVMHRDLKPANILYNNKGQLKICDFGLARTFSSFPRHYTRMVVTLWYRAPELLLGTRQYSAAIDVWSVGCIMAELLTGRPLIAGNGEIDQLRKMYETLGDPDSTTFAGLPFYDKLKYVKRSHHAPRLSEMLISHDVSVTDEMLDLLSQLLHYDPRTRIAARDARDHPWFRCHPLPKDVALMPTFKSSNEEARR